MWEYDRILRILTVLAFFWGLLPMYGATLDLATAERFAKLALDCVQREYPVKIAHSLNSAADAKVPRELNPAFYGCFDWHSSVHGHWMLARLARTFPGSALSIRAKAALGKNLTKSNLDTEAAYVQAPGRAGFERPYGLAWLLQLTSELRSWNDPDARQWAESIRPLETAVVLSLKTWIAKLTHPVRSGEHSNTAFSLGLMLDYAAAAGDQSFGELLKKRARDFYLADRGCPLNYEPSGEDFLSPCLAEADVMRRVLARDEFSRWFAAFLPQVPSNASTAWLRPGVVSDPADGKLAHLDGLNLSRAWMLERIAATLPAGNPRTVALRASSAEHASDGLKAVTGEHYEGGHWLGSFAVHLLTR